MKDLKKIKILVPIDFKEDSVNGLQTAIEIAEKKKCEITLFHVRTQLEHMINQGYQGFAENSKAYKLGDKKLEEEEEKIKMELHTLAMNYGLGNVNYKIKVTSGYYEEELEKFVDRNKTDLIVVGISGNNSLAELLTGNKAEQLIRMTKTPVLAVKKFHGKGEMKNLLLGMELKDYNEETIESIRKITEYLKMKIFIVYVKHSTFEKDDEVFQRLEEYAEKCRFQDYSVHILSVGDTHKKLEEFANKNNIDIIAGITKGESGFFKLIYGSNTDELIEKTDKSVLAILE